MEFYTYTIHIEPAEEGGFVAVIPALPGCHTQGETLEETIAHAREAIEGFLESLVKRGKTIPVEPHPAPGLTVGISVRAPMNI